ncbi:aminoglycoside resistance protein [Mycolicibacterium madagascariense]|nr:aminoglycoside resistance protein [Mycolicibacterium madagascariense]
MWGLRQDGAAHDGAVALTLPVRTSEGAAAVLKVSSPTAGSGQAHLALRRWGGDGAVRLLRADPHRHAVLLERLRPRTLDDLPDAAACEVVAGLYRRLHVAPLPQVPSLTTVVAQWAHQVDERPRNAALPRRLIEQAVASTRELAVETATTDVLLHGDLHHGSVLAADREPWLAISPRPVNGDRHAELAPMLLHRLDDLGGRLRDGIRARFYALVDAAGLDEDLARAWTFIQVVHAATRAIDDGADLTRYVAIAKALQD